MNPHSNMLNDKILNILQKIIQEGKILVAWDNGVIGMEILVNKSLIATIELEWCISRLETVVTLKKKHPLIDSWIPVHRYYVDDNYKNSINNQIKSKVNEWLYKQVSDIENEGIG